MPAKPTAKPAPIAISPIGKVNPVLTAPIRPEPIKSNIAIKNPIKA